MLQLMAPATQSNELKTLTFPLEILKSQLGKYFSFAADANLNLPKLNRENHFFRLVRHIFHFRRKENGKHQGKKNLSEFPTNINNRWHRLHLKWNEFVRNGLQAELMTKNFALSRSSHSASRKLTN